MSTVSGRWLLWRADPMLPRNTLAEYLLTLCHETGEQIQDTDAKCDCLVHRARRTRIAERDIAECKQQVATAETKTEEAVRQLNLATAELTRIQTILRQL